MQRSRPRFWKPNPGSTYSADILALRKLSPSHHAPSKSSKQHDGKSLGRCLAGWRPTTFAVLVLHVSLIPITDHRL